MLQCEVLGVSPKPKMEWKDGSGKILPGQNLKETESGGRYNVQLQTTVTKSGTFRCVVTQEEISHQVYAETQFTFNGEIILSFIFCSGWAQKHLHLHKSKMFQTECQILFKF